MSFIPGSFVNKSNLPAVGMLDFQNFYEIENLNVEAFAKIKVSFKNLTPQVQRGLLKDLIKQAAAEENAKLTNLFKLYHLLGLDETQRIRLSEEVAKENNSPTIQKFLIKFESDYKIFQKNVLMEPQQGSVKSQEKTLPSSPAAPLSVFTNDVLFTAHDHIKENNYHLAMELARAQSDETLKVRIYNQVVRYFVKQKLWKEAIEICEYNIAEKSRTDSYIAIIEGLLAENLDNKALEIAYKFSNSSIFFETIIKWWLRERQLYRKVLTLIKSSDKEKGQNYLVAIIRMLGTHTIHSHRKSAVYSALFKLYQLLDETRRCQLSEEFSKAGNPVYKLFQLAEKESPLPGIKSPGEGLHTASKQLTVASGQMIEEDDTLKNFKEVRERQINALNKFVKFIVEFFGGESESINKALQAISTSSLAQAGTPSAFKVEVIKIRNALARILKDIDAVRWEVLREKMVGMDKSSFSEFSDIPAEMDLVSTIAVYREMDELLKQPQMDPAAQRRVILTNWRCFEDTFLEAIDPQLNDKLGRPLVLYIVKECLQEENFPLAFEIAKRTNSDDLKAKIYEKIVYAYSRKNPEVALATLEKYKQFIPETSRAKLYDEVICGFLEQEKDDEAVRLASRLPNKSHCLELISKSWVWNGKLDKALKLLGTCDDVEDFFDVIITNCSEEAVALAEQSEFGDHILFLILERRCEQGLQSKYAVEKDLFGIAKKIKNEDTRFLATKLINKAIEEAAKRKISEEGYNFSLD